MDEYVYLFSNFNAIKYYGRPNKIGQFKNQLACGLSLSANTRVALSEIAYTKSWYNVRNTHSITLYDELGTQLLYKNDGMKIKPGFHDNPESLVNEINKTLKLFPIKKPPVLEYNARENYVYLKSGETDNLTVLPDLGEEVENILGLRNRNTFVYEYHYGNEPNVKYEFKNMDVFENDVLKGFHPVEMNAGVHYLCVYSDVVAQSFAGDTKSQLLRIVEIPRKYKFGETVHIRYTDRNYKNIYSDKVQSIEISIRDSSNRPINFTSGQCTCVLHFTDKSI